MKYKCPTITITQDINNMYLVTDDVTPVIGKGITYEGAARAYQNGLDLLGRIDWVDYMKSQDKSGGCMKKRMIDLVDIKTELKNGALRPFVKRDKVYIEDAQTGECIMICDLKEDNERKEVW